MRAGAGGRSLPEGVSERDLCGGSEGVSGSHRPAGGGRRGAGLGQPDDHLGTARAGDAWLSGRRSRWAARTSDPDGVVAVAGGQRACRHGICDTGAGGQADNGRA